MTNISTIKDRFEEKYEINEDGCWTWIAGKYRDGYGMLAIDRKPHRAHRVSYCIYRGDIPRGLCVLHTCDNPACVNPDHLFLGTHKDNMGDKAKKGRSVNSPMLGEVNPNSKLTMKEVEEIRDLLKSKLFLHREISNLYDVSRSTVTRISTGRGWIEDSPKLVRML